MVKNEAGYNHQRNVVVLGEPVKLAKEDYEAVQDITNGRFASLYEYEKFNGVYNERKIVIENGRIIRLDLSEMRLVELHSSIGDVTNLEYLVLEQNRLQTLPESIGNLRNLKDLSATKNILTQIPESIGNLRNLKKLFLGNNLLTSIPESIGNLTSIEYFCVDNNRLTNLPESICNLNSPLLIANFQNNPFDEKNKRMLKNLNRKRQKEQMSTFLF